MTAVAEPRGPRLRALLDDLPVYRAGRPAALGPAGKLSANENPFDPLPSVVAALRDAAATVSRYPDPSAEVVVRALAERLSVAPERIAVGAGSVALCQQLVQITADPGDEVVFAWRSFESYPIVTRLADAVPRPVPLTGDGGHDLDAMLEAIGPRTRLVFVCSPNNPTGTVVPAAALADFAAAVPEDVLVVVDEAYVEFAGGVDPGASLALAAERPNVCVLRTFSKAHGLAGLRIGFAVAAPEVADGLRRTTLPFAVTALAQHAALASLAADAELRARVGTVVEQRERLARGLRAAGWAPLASDGNFVWVPDEGGRTGVLAAASEAAGFSVRAFPGDGVRITVGSPETVDAYLSSVPAPGAKTP